MILSCSLLVLPSYPSWGQTVQLPTYRVFSVSTTVSVPDRGHALLGGVNRARTASSSRSLPLLGRLPGAGRAFGSRQQGSGISAGGARISATIIDLDQWDRAIREQVVTSDERDQRTAQVEKAAEFLSRHVARSSSGKGRLDKERAVRPVASLEAIRRQNQLVRRQQQDEALRLYARGQQALESGRHGVAQIYLKMALRQADGDLRRRILSHDALASTAHEQQAKSN